MTKPQPFADLHALNRNRNRADPGALFLQRAAQSEVEDRLAMVNKTFQFPTIVAAHPSLWVNRFVQAKIVPETETLPLEPGQHDLVVHSLGLHWANDPVGQLIQCRRALAPDGLMLGVTLGGQTLHELRACLAEAESVTTGGLSPRVAPMAEIRDLGGLLQRAGFALPVADCVPLRAVYKSMWHLMRDLRAMGEANAMAARGRKTMRRSILDHAADSYVKNFPADEGGIIATFELIVLTGWAPDASQQKPMRPGSAKVRLADALQTNEKSLFD
ncbi:MAG: methyltransferase domain-containing protein [Tateyamaria sp.]|jgi:SAM-dependent methyltransferase|nr:methyltransferase domain-containing protein [Tateyamaria sp.]